MSRELTRSESNLLRGQMLGSWDWDGGYWHPLKCVARNDLLAFDSSCLEKLLPEANLQKLLAEIESEDVILFREHDPDQMLKIEELPFVYGWSEAVLVPCSMSWVVYWSHEDTITFGGVAQIAAVKECVPNWKAALWR